MTCTALLEVRSPYGGLHEARVPVEVIGRTADGLIIARVPGDKRPWRIHPRRFNELPTLPPRREPEPSTTAAPSTWAPYEHITNIRQRQRAIAEAGLAMRARGHTFAHIAAELGVARSTVQKWVAGRVPTPAPTKVSPQKRAAQEAAAQMRAEGLSFSQIGAALSADSRTIRRWLGPSAGLDNPGRPRGSRNSSPGAARAEVIPPPSAPAPGEHCEGAET